MDLSLVVCTRNRATLLSEALPHFSRLQSPASWELVMVDNGSTDATAEILAALAQSAPMRLTLVNEPKRGLSAARNAGWRRAQGRIVVFTDDDCYPATDFLDQVGHCFSESALGFLGGRVLLFDPNDYPITIQTLEQRVEIAPRAYVGPSLIHGANCSFLREALARLGGFDERLGAGTPLCSGEDVDVLARASALGYAGAYDPRPLVFHHHRRTTQAEADQLMAGYDIGRGAFFAKGLRNRQTRGAFLWPVLRRIGGNLARRDFAVLRRELAGAWKYTFG